MLLDHGSSTFIVGWFADRTWKCSSRLCTCLYKLLCSLYSRYNFFFYVQGSVHRKYIPIYIQQDATFTQFIYICKLLYMFRVVPPPVIRSAYNYIYSIWYLSHRYCHLPLSWKSWNRFECAVGGVRHDCQKMLEIRKKIL